MMRFWSEGFSLYVVKVKKQVKDLRLIVVKLSIKHSEEGL